jgi:Holliday junction resolvase RusA-like endonuclease
MSDRITIWVAGEVRPGGSKNHFVNKRTGRIVVVDAGGPKTYLWKDKVAKEAREQYQDGLVYGALVVECDIFIDRPKSHYGTGKNSKILKASSPKHPIYKPDATKLWRSTEDALTGVVWHDDAQIVKETVEKIYTDPYSGEGPSEAGAYIKIWELE